MRQFLSLIATTKPKYSCWRLALALRLSPRRRYESTSATGLISCVQRLRERHRLPGCWPKWCCCSCSRSFQRSAAPCWGLASISQNLRKNVWNKLTTLRVKYFDTVKAGEASSRLVNDTSQVKQLLATTFPQTVSSVLTHHRLGGHDVVRMDWRMSLAMLIAVPVVFVIMIPLMMFAPESAICARTPSPGSAASPTRR